MATQTTGGGSTVSFGNAPQANTDAFTFTEDASNILVLNVMANDLGGAAKALFSLDDGTSASASTKSYAPADLLVKDVAYSSDSAGAAGTSDHSALGARIWIETDGTVHYDKGDINAKLQALAVGETLTDTFTYAIQLGNGTLSWATVTLQFTGLNDAPSIVVGSTTANGAFSEATNTTGSSASDQTTGTIVFSDVDAHDTHTVSKSGPSFAWSSGTLTSAQTTALTAASNLNLVTADSTNAATATGSVNWAYSAADKAFDFLAAGETLAVTYTITIDDGHGGSVTQPITITVTGTNDQPTIVAGLTTATGAITEAAGTNGSIAADTASGLIAFADVDLSDAHTVSQGVPSFIWSGGSLTAGQISALTNASSLALTKTDSTGSGAGSVAWSYNAQDKTFDFLAAGQTLTATYAVSIDDGHGGTTSQNVVVTITGTNDVPVITSGAQTGAITELAGQLGSTTSDTANGAVTFTDADLSDSHTVSVMGVTASGATSGLPSNATLLSWLTLGTLTDSPNGGTGSNGWSFSAQDKNFDYLAAGQTVTLSYTVQVADTHGGSASQNVVVTVTGTNDQPSIVAAATHAAGAVTEDATSPDLSTTGTIAFDDVDLIDTHTASVTPDSGNTLGGTLTLGAVSESPTTSGGTVGWTYTVADNATDDLAAGQTATESFTVSIADGHGGTVDQIVTVTVTGTNEAPTIVAGSTTATGAVTEDATTPDLSTTGTIA
ncbi:VCBS domain-containing protein, partial [Bradyrhizobium sp. Gha]|uniref:beta strand repeat-containing protein n=1 Tax=Bradyrhizobium sp. Gha TaxID=1855318 RepID=UPI0008E6D2DE